MKKIDLNKITIGTKIKYRHPTVKNSVHLAIISVIHKEITIDKHGECVKMWFEDIYSGCEHCYIGNNISSEQIIEIINE